MNILFFLSILGLFLPFFSFICYFYFKPSTSPCWLFPLLCARVLCEEKFIIFCIHEEKRWKEKESRNKKKLIFRENKFIAQFFIYIQLLLLLLFCSFTATTAGVWTDRNALSFTVCMLMFMLGLVWMKKKAFFTSSCFVGFPLCLWFCLVN